MANEDRGGYVVVCVVVCALLTWIIPWIVHLCSENYELKQATQTSQHRGQTYVKYTYTSSSYSRPSIPRYQVPKIEIPEIEMISVSEHLSHIRIPGTTIYDSSSRTLSNLDWELRSLRSEISSALDDVNSRLRDEWWDNTIRRRMLNSYSYSSYSSDDDTRMLRDLQSTLMKVENDIYRIQMDLNSGWVRPPTSYYRPIY